MKMKHILASIACAVCVGGAFFFFAANGSGFLKEDSIVSDRERQEGLGKKEEASNVTMVDGKQIVEIRVKGGYQPRESFAKAGVPTDIRFVTNGTFDCSSSVSIPSKKIQKNLSSTGTTDVEIGTSEAGSLRGTCSMGMYSFAIQFSE